MYSKINIKWGGIIRHKNVTLKFNIMQGILIIAILLNEGWSLIIYAKIVILALVNAQLTDLEKLKDKG